MNWILDSEEFRSPTDVNSSVQNLLDCEKECFVLIIIREIYLLASSGTYWTSTQNRDAWVIFDLKHQYNISGIRILGW
jgi:hypothetical protein